MSKKGDHRLVRRLLAVTHYRLPFSSQIERVRRQRQWLIEIEHLLDPTRKPPKQTKQVAQAVDTYLVALTTCHTHDAEDKRCAAQINQTFRNFWWGLFTCYDVEGLPRTNNQLERFILQIKMGYRRISGRKNVHDYLLRYGIYAALLDYTESEADLGARLAFVTQEDFISERKKLSLSLLQETKIHRFRCQRTQFLADLEAQWEAAFSDAKPHNVG